ncbi:hypothetical protein BJY01DRAFT_213461 [Aspergillus pseudoustus]|uniref:RNase III domain-containing protein n=1 Tax=Aspergillus pseudoustus TaxID=1810923 RepID=A0ABR4K2T2_9EURO
MASRAITPSLRRWVQQPELASLAPSYRTKWSPQRFRRGGRPLRSQSAIPLCRFLFMAHNNTDCHPVPVHSRFLHQHAKSRAPDLPPLQVPSEFTRVPLPSSSLVQRPEAPRDISVGEQPTTSAMKQPQPNAVLPRRTRTFLKGLNLVFKNDDLIINALRTADAKGRPANKSLAFVGAQVLWLSLLAEGHRRQLKLRLLKQVLFTVTYDTNLASRGFDAGLLPHIDGGKLEAQDLTDHLMATTVRAIIGAVFLDKNMDIAAVRPIISALRIWPTAKREDPQ